MILGGIHIYTGGKKEKRNKLGSINEPKDRKNKAVTMPISSGKQGSKFVVGAGGVPWWG